MNINLPNATIRYLPHFISSDQASAMYELLRQQIRWQQDEIILYGKRVKIPRMQAWYGDDKQEYQYSNLKMTALPWLSSLQELKVLVEQECQLVFNSMLANFYRDHKDAVAWHSDDEPELGHQPTIASLSFGATRNFNLKHKQSGEKYTIPLISGSLLIMSGETQAYWQHTIPRTKLVKSGRINLTYRKIV